MAEQHLPQDALARPKSPQVINSLMLPILRVVVSSVAALVAVTQRCGDSFREGGTAGHRRRLLLLPPPGFCGISAAPGQLLGYRGVSEERDTAPGAGTRCIRRPGAGPARGWQGEALRGQPVRREDGADGPLSSLKLLAVLQPSGRCSGGFCGAPQPR